jgi:hypothetical protein
MERLALNKVGSSELDGLAGPSGKMPIRSQ